ncbi:MAG: hypothetical protein ACK52J_02025 [bacterium]|jgi:hypothetical protein
MIEEKILKGGDKKMAFTIPSLINAYLNIVNNNSYIEIIKKLKGFVKLITEN